MFSIFSPHGIFNLRLNWLSSVLLIFFFPSHFWYIKNKFSLILHYITKSLHKEFLSIFGKFNFPGVTFLSVTLFIYILINNFWGLFPYIFTSSRHGVYRFSLAFPLWVGHIIWARTFNNQEVLAHLVPIRTPVALIPLIVLIEVIRRIIRPFTLAIRLAANIIAGHLLLSLLRRKIEKGLRVVFIRVLVGLILLTILELAVRVIQRYVFRLLSTLYLNDVIRNKFVCLGSVFNISNFLFEEIITKYKVYILFWSQIKGKFLALNNLV